MKKTDVKLRSKSLVIVNLFLIFTLMTVSVYSWFTIQVDNNVDIYEMQVEADNALELSFKPPTDPEATWSNSLNLSQLTNEDGQSVLDTMKFVEVTGNGSDFFIPELTQLPNYAQVNSNSVNAWTTPDPNNQYLEFTVYMRSKDPLNVFLSSDSFAAPACGANNVIGESCGNPSTYASGNKTFSKDCVVGALRVAFNRELDSDNDQKCVWITNPEYHLDNLVGSTEFEMKTDGLTTTYSDGTGEENEAFIWNNPKVHYYYAANKATTVSQLDNVFLLLGSFTSEVKANPSASDKTYIAQLNGTTDENGYYYDDVNFTVWIEGCDTEARRVLVDGKFNLSLIFDTIGIKN